MAFETLEAYACVVSQGRPQVVSLPLGGRAFRSRDRDAFAGAAATTRTESVI